jgi:carbonic anhydrase
MTKILDEVLAANAKYAESFRDKGNLSLPPSRHFAILTCMDARLDPAKYAGLAEGDAGVIRNAGGRASDDAIRSLVISYKLLGTREWFVIYHSMRGAAFLSGIRSGPHIFSRVDHSLREGPRVCRLPAGGSRIRTPGPA